MRYRNDPAMALKVEKNLQMSLNFKLSQKLLASITTREPSGMEFKWSFIKVENCDISTLIDNRPDRKFTEHVKLGPVISRDM